MTVCGIIYFRCLWVTKLICIIVVVNEYKNHSSWGLRSFGVLHSVEPQNRTFPLHCGWSQKSCSDSTCVLVKYCKMFLVWTILEIGYPTFHCYNLCVFVCLQVFEWHGNCQGTKRLWTEESSLWCGSADKGRLWHEYFIVTGECSGSIKCSWWSFNVLKVCKPLSWTCKTTGHNAAWWTFVIIVILHCTTVSFSVTACTSLSMIIVPSFVM